MLLYLSREDHAVIAAGLTHEKVGHTNQGLWHHKGMQLPAYIQHIANDLRQQKGFTTSRAIATAVSRCKVWCAGGGGVKPDTRAKACAAIAEWEKLKLQSKAKRLANASAAGGSAMRFAARQAWDPSKHPRDPAGGSKGGEFAPASKTPAPTNQRPVGEGESGKRVSDLQKRLNEFGAKLKVDGQFGSKTLAAVREFQKAHGLKVDGLVGPKTTAALRGTAKHGPKHAAAADGSPELVTIPDVEILAAGTWQLSSGRQTFTRADLKNAVEAAACPAIGQPIIKIGHVDKRFTPSDGEPALGRLTNMRTDKPGVKLRADLTNMPSWLGHISAAAFPRRSVEGSYNFHCQIGHKHPFVITALALLGVTPPGVGVLQDLKDLNDLFYRAASSRDPGRAWRTGPIESIGGIMPVTEEDVRRAYYAGADIPQHWWITELQMDPSQLIVTDGQGSVYRVPFEVQGSSVNFGDAEQLETFEELAASRGSGPATVYASAEESRSFQAGDQGYGGGGTPSSQGGDGSSGDQNNPPNPGPGPDALGLDASWEGDLTDLPDLSGISIADLEAAIGSGALQAAAELTAELEAAAKLGTGSRFNKLKAALAAKGATNPGALAAWIGRKKYGKGAFMKLAKAAHHKKHASSGGTTEGVAEVDFSEDQLASLRASLGLAEGEDVTPDLIVSGMTSRKVAASGLPQGVMLVDRERFEELNKRVNAAEAYQQRQRIKERDQVIGQAVRDGKFTAARKDAYVRLWDSDPEGAREVIAAMQKNVVPVDDIGSPGGPEDEGLDDEFKSLFPPAMS